MAKSIMTIFVLLISISSLWFFKCGGAKVVLNPTSGDPAPGRSPGPPSSTETNNVCRLDGILEGKGAHRLNLTLRHQLFKSDVLVPGVKYQVVINRVKAEDTAIMDLTISSSVDGVVSGDFASVDDDQDNYCGPHIFKSQFKGLQLVLNWTFQSNHFEKAFFTFELNYKINNEPTALYRLDYIVPVVEECQLYLNENAAMLNHKELPRDINDCQLWFPRQPETDHHGLVIELTRLNVPCAHGFIHFTGLIVTQHQHYRSPNQTHLCGKLEELAENERHIYFPPSHTQPYVHLHGQPVFALTYRLVDYCYNVTFATRNGSFSLSPKGELQCTFKIYLPYGNRVALKLQIGGSGTGDPTPNPDLLFTDAAQTGKCLDGLMAELHDGADIWTHCAKPGDPPKEVELVSRENKVMLKVAVRGAGVLGLKFSYRADPVEDVVGVCGFGWVAMRQFCVSVVEEALLPWAQAEMECGRRGGHLASIRSEHDQVLLNHLLVNSPGYRDHNVYWVGASDKIHEGDFRWSDGLPFSYTNWFPGWAQHGHYNKQPNDDGLSKQDCVEVRRKYSLPTSTDSFATTFMWNDRDCATPNYFVCERLQNDEPLEDNWSSDCNRSVALSRQQPTTVSSPGFPRPYPDNAACDTVITAPPGYRIVLDFEELVLENEPACSYDYLEILEANQTNGSAARRLCGDWSTKLKLLRFVSKGSKLKLRFSSDYSHRFSGYKARVSMENAMQCADDRLHMFNNSCYLIVSYPEVTWLTAQQICRGMKANLASVSSPEEQRFITTNIRRTSEYRTSALYWLGAKSDEQTTDFQWLDGNPMNFLGWLPGQRPAKPDTLTCLGIQWTLSPTPMLPTGLYWRAQKCNQIGGYVCKRRHQLLSSEIDFNRTLTGAQGNASTPNYPGYYYNNLDFTLRIIGPERTRLVIRFLRLDIEEQVDCLYDSVELQSTASDAVKWCGTHDNKMDHLDFVSAANEAVVRFHSDYSISGSGFYLTWQAIDVSACPMQTLTAKEGTISSPNYPHFLLAHLDCTINILAPAGKRIWLDFAQTKPISKQLLLELSLGKQALAFKPFATPHLLTEGSFLSIDERVQVKFRTADHPQGTGFKLAYKIVNSIRKEKVVRLFNSSSGLLLHLNYPDNPPANVDFLQHFVAPPGYIISLEVYNVKVSENGDCADANGLIEVYDHYSDGNGTVWKLCYAEDAPIPTAITSYLNTLHLRQHGGLLGIPLNGSLRLRADDNYKQKLLNYKEERVEGCKTNPCLNNGKCVSKNSNHYCKCIGQFTGLFCALTHCDLEPCVFGTCALTETSFKCHCKAGYVGLTCDQKRKPCEGNPCESRGKCIERGEGFQCRCHAWWEGARCEKRMLHIPYKPLSERMFHEPFWLGLMTVFVVMAVIGLVWCAKRHFPEKIEKLLAEENDRNRSTMSSLRSASVREQLAAASGAAAVTVTPSPGPGAPRSLFGRLGIRKPSILSLTSPHASGYVPATARTFSLDDLLKTPPRRTPSPKKKRNNSTPTKKNVAEKKQILQQLISPGNKQISRKVSLGELIQMSEQRVEQAGTSKSLQVETKFMIDPDPVQSALSDPKLEKKVTFARLLNKVSAEMSTGTEIELGIMQTNRLGCMFARPSSTPPSPGVDARSPNSTSSNQDLLNNKRRMVNGRPKPASADSILAMFRNFSSSSAGANYSSSLRVSPSTTPTASSPQDDIVGDDESSTSSVYTPVSFSSGAPESPVFLRSTIEVPVLDPLSAHKSCNNGSNFLHPPTILLEIPSTINKCLSPIRELPTPLPSPARTPVMRRSAASSSIEDNDISDDRISVEIPNISISCSDPEDDIHCTDIAIDPQAEDGFILEEAAAMSHHYHHRKSRPPPLGQTHRDPITITIEPPPLIIPTFIIQTPSPTHTKNFPAGSPPPHKSLENCFHFAPPKQHRKLNKDFDKPTSLDLPGAPPMITITCNMSEADSDAESISPAVNKGSGPAAGGMTYLSPFSIGAHNASESNLSSSGYSSMASPGPSRCGSSNPLCPSEMEDPPGSGHGGPRRQSITPVLKTTSSSTAEKTGTEEQQRRGRSDSETLSDDPQLESNDEGIGTDHIDEKIDDGDVRSAKELEVFIVGEKTNDLIDVFANFEDPFERLLPPPLGKHSLQLPSIVIQCDSSEHLSSRSESPLSDRTVGRVSTQSYPGKHKDFLPFTDSDGLYDFPSSDKVNVLTQKKIGGRKRDRKTNTILRNCKTPSPTKLLQNLLDVPYKETYKVPPPRKLSPKRRVTRSQVVSSSSSSDSIHSAREVRLSSSSPSPDTIRWSSPVSWLDDKCQKSHEALTVDEPCDDVNTAMLPKSADVPFANKHQKVSRLRAISHQIRFLRRLELSLKRRDRAISPSDSLDSGEESPRATSPLLHKGPKVEIRKSSSIGKLPPNPTSNTCKNRRGKYKRGDLLLPKEGASWKKIVITGSGHSD